MMVGYVYRREALIFITCMLVKKGKVTVPKHKGDIPKGTVNSILKQAGLK